MTIIIGPGGIGKYDPSKGILGSIGKAPASSIVVLPPKKSSSGGSSSPTTTSPSGSMRVENIPADIREKLGYDVQIIQPITTSKSGMLTPSDIGYYVGGSYPTNVNTSPFETLVTRSKGAGFVRPSEVAKRQESMDISKKYFVGIEPESNIPIYSPKTQYLREFGYSPGRFDPGSVQRYIDVQQSLSAQLSNAQSGLRTISQQQRDLPSIIESIGQLRNTPSDSLVTYQELLPGGGTIEKTVSPSEALSVFEDYKAQIQENIVLLPEYRQSEEDIKQAKGLIGGYQKIGYDIQKTDEGYEFVEPSAQRVYRWKHGEELGGLAFGSIALLESPLAIKSIFHSVQGALTGEELLGESRKEDLSRFALGFDYALSKGRGVDFVVKSPAMVEGVYIPSLTFGASKMVSLGAEGLAPYISGSSKLFSSKIPQSVKTLSMPYMWAGKKTVQFFSGPLGQQTAKYGLFAALEGPELLKISKERPRDLLGETAESLFTWELSWKAAESGFKDTKLYRQNILEQDIRELTNVPQSVRYYEGLGKEYMGVKTLTPQDAEFFSFGKQLIKQKGVTMQPIRVSTEAAGTVKTFPIGGVDLSMASGTVKTSTKWTKNLTRFERTSFRPLEASGFDFAKFSGGDVLEYSIGSVGKGPLIEPTVGESFAQSFKIGEKGGFKFETWLGKTDFSNLLSDVAGRSRTLGFSFIGETPSKLEVASTGGRLLSKTKTKPFNLLGQKIQSQSMKTAVKSVSPTLKTPLISGKSVVKTITRPSFGSVLGSVSLPKLEEMEEGILVSDYWDKQIPSVKSRKLSLLDVKGRLLEDYDTRKGLLTGGLSDYGLLTEPRDEHKTGSFFKTDFGREFKLDQRQKMGLLSRLQLKNLTSLQTPIITQTRIGVPKISIPTIPFLNDGGRKPSGSRSRAVAPSGGFKAYYRRKKKWVPIVNRTLSRSDALSLMGQGLDNSAAVSGKILPSQGKVKPLRLNLKGFEGIAHKFSKKGDVYVEKNKFRIDSPGEIKQISMKGWLSNQRKARLNKIGNNLLGVSSKKGKKRKVKYV